MINILCNVKKSNVIRRVSGMKIPCCWRNQHTIKTIPYQSFDTLKQSQIKRKISGIFCLIWFFSAIHLIPWKSACSASSEGHGRAEGDHHPCPWQGSSSGCLFKKHWISRGSMTSIYLAKIKKNKKWWRVDWNVGNRSSWAFSSIFR